MTVEVTVKHQIPFLFHALNQLLCMVYRGMKFFIGVDPLSVQVDQTEVASVVADNDAVRVEHGHYLEDEILSQNFSNVRIT
jgi:hypothetical protein